MNSKPFYDARKTYKENLAKGPFGGFADGVRIKTEGVPAYKFLKHKVFLPFGIPAGPLIGSKFCTAALQKGFDIVVYKTVRSEAYSCHPWPNIMNVRVHGNLTMEKLKKNIVADFNFDHTRLSITNSFGVPSKDASIWQRDVKKALKQEKKGQLIILSFMGTVKNNQTEKEFINNYVRAAKLSKQTGAKVLEMNLSCPNVGNEGLVCYNLDMTERICRTVRNSIGKTPLIIKIGYFKNNTELRRIAEIADRYVDAISAINTLQGTIVDMEGNQALPGKSRLRSGICGEAIRWAGLDMVRRLKHLKDAHQYSYTIIGVGGVMEPEDYNAYVRAGADCVMSATGSMWNPYLAYQIKKKLRIPVMYE